MCGDTLGEGNNVLIMKNQKVICFKKIKNYA